MQCFPFISLSPGLRSPYTCLRELKSEERGLCLIHLLRACAKHVAAGSLDNANIVLVYITLLDSPAGDTMQRIVAYFSRAFTVCLLRGWPSLHNAINSTKIPSYSVEFLGQKLFFEFCPFLKLAYLITNQAIMEVMKGEKMVHIIDLHSFEPAQWINLPQALSSRPGGPPHLKITGIHEQKEFIPIIRKLEDLDVESLPIKTGKALAVSSVVQMHSLLAYDDRVRWRNLLATPNYMDTVHSQKILDVKEELVDKDLIKCY
ncbi:hypothetical protein Ancab_034713 [Ancistrocladus abbreviatus]